jgi:two-component system, OmpR family, sensor histidine kinase KdpD
MLSASDMRAARRRYGPVSVPWWAGGPGVAAAMCGLGLGLGLNSTAAAGGFVLAVTVAALVWGAKASLLASVASFFGLNFFFTPPLRTFVVGKVEDLVALGAFLVVSLVVSRLLSGLVTERQRAERREREMAYLFKVAQALLGGSKLKETLTVVAQALVDALALGRVDIRVEDPDQLEESSIAVSAGQQDVPGPPSTLPLGRQAGSVVLYARDENHVDDETLGLAEAFVSQAALAVERARFDAEARRARLESEASDLRAALFSAVTHDLKTPLSSVKAAVTSLLDEEVRLSSDDTKALLETILAETDRLGRLLANVLELARIKAGALESRTERADLAELVGAVLQRLAPRMAGRMVHVGIRDDLPEVAVDVVQIDQVLTNLMENALRFAPPDAPVRITAGLWDSSVEIRVSDLGPGIPEFERDRVFAPFYSADRGDGRGGSGLGLAISRAILNAHGGRIGIEETPGGGTTVVFTLPVADAQ